MKTTLFAAGLVALAGAASAQDVYTNPGTGPIAALSSVGPFAFNNIGSIGNVTGINIMADMNATGAAFGQDSYIIVKSPNGTSQAFGGNTGSAPPPGTISWLAGVGTPPGFGGASVINLDFGSLAFGPSNGTWEFTFGHAYSGGTVEFKNVKISFVPAPGALGLLAMGGLVAGRRRR